VAINPYFGFVMQTPDEFKTALDLYKFAAAGANTLWTFFSTIGLACVTFAFGERTTLRGRGKLALGISFLVFALVNNYLIVDKQQFATDAWEVMKNTGTCGSKPASLYNQLICAAQPMEPWCVRAGHFAMTFAILGGIYLAHRRDRRSSPADVT
jgi:hypothetical protein